MILFRNISLPSNLNTIQANSNLKKNVNNNETKTEDSNKCKLNNSYKSFSDFNHLKLEGNQIIETFGNFSRNPKQTKNNRKKVIKYFYKNLLRSKL